MSLSDIDRLLLQRCIDGAPRAWQDFVDRFLGLVIHVANHTADARGMKLDNATRDDLVSEVFVVLLANDKGVLRRFRRNSSLATYLTVVARRVIARRLHAFYLSTNRASGTNGNGRVSGNGRAGSHVDQHGKSVESDGSENSPLARIDDADEIERLMKRLDPQEANVVRMYHLEGKSYQEISLSVGLAENSIGPLLSRARQKMREGA